MSLAQSFLLGLPSEFQSPSEEDNGVVRLTASSLPQLNGSGKSVFGKYFKRFVYANMEYVCCKE